MPPVTNNAANTLQYLDCYYTPNLSIFSASTTPSSPGTGGAGGSVTGFSSSSTHFTSTVSSEFLDPIGSLDFTLLVI